jgi:hypothetical protein
MRHLCMLLAACALLGTLPSARAADVLDDDQLDQVTAGTASAAYENGRLLFDAQRTTGSGRAIAATGDVNFNAGSATVNTGVLRLEDNAQGNLHALVNTNAVNSAVQVMINLNVNVDSHVGSLTQINGMLPRP